MPKINSMKGVNLNISPLHAETLAAHLIIVMKNCITGKPEGSIPTEVMDVLTKLDQAYQKLTSLSGSRDDETPQSISFTLPEAEAFIKAFKEDPFQSAAQQDAFYEGHSYSAYFAQIFSGYLEQVSEAYVEALAA